MLPGIATPSGWRDIISHAIPLTDGAEMADERDRRQEIARLHRGKVTSPVSLDLISTSKRRPWHGSWVAYDMLMAQDLRGKRVLLPGCGFGEDAIRLASLGAEVFAADASPELLDIARRRALHLGVEGIHFDVMQPGALAYPDGLLDVVFYDDILHHLDIPATMAETARVLKPGGRVVISEHYTHSAVQRIRDSRFVTDYLHQRMIGFVYGARDLYVSEDGHKINEHELAQIDAALDPDRMMRFFSLFSGRVLPADSATVARLDCGILNMSEGIGRLLSGRVVISGTPIRG